MDSVASRYAIALLAVAREENAVSDYVKEATSLVSLLKENNELLSYFKAYGLTSTEKKEIIDTVFKPYFKEYIINLMYILIDNSRGGYMLDVFKEFERIASLELNIRKGIVYSTIKLDSKEILALENKVSNLLNAKITLSNEIDSTLLGGVKIQVDDYVIDDSLKNRLEKLKDSVMLKKGE